MFSLVSIQVFSQFTVTNQAQLIVEGEVTSTSSKWNEDKTHIITESYVHLKIESALNISDLPAGIYLCRVSTKNGISNKKFVKI